MKTDLDFLIIGAQKSGTTSLFEYLRRHPELYLPPAKEVPYFSHDPVWARGWNIYIRQTFAYADSQTKWGTATPHYMAGSIFGADKSRPTQYSEHTIPERIREQLPEVRLIAALRNPIERAFSHHRMMQMRGQETRTFDEAIETLLRQHELERAREIPDPTTGYVVWSEYGRILKGYRDLFPATQLHLLLTNDLDREPEEQLRRIHRFLGVTNDFIPDNLGVRYRQGADAVRTTYLNPQVVRRRARRSRTARQIWNGIPKPVRHRFHHSIERAAYAYDLWNRQNPDEMKKPSRTTVEALRAHFAEDRATLESLWTLALPW